jgi:hypothetical protein
MNFSEIQNSRNALMVLLQDRGMYNCAYKQRN